LRIVSLSQIRIIFVDPILARRIENVYVYRVFKRECLMRKIRRDAQDFTSAYDYFSAPNEKSQSAFEYVTDLLIRVMMKRDMRSFFE
jgi:hypothetical protein